MANVFDTLFERDFIEQMTDQEEVKALFEKESVPFYIGFDQQLIVFMLDTLFL